MTNLLAFVGTAFLLAMLPGPGQAVMTRQILTHGRRPALMSTLGTGAGLMLWSLAAALGLSTVFLARPEALTALRYGGAALLVLLGVRTLRGRGSHHRDVPASGPGATAAAASFLAGLGTNLGNPKAGLFALALLPQFISPGANLFWATTGLGTVWALVTMTWYVLFVSLVDRGQQILAAPRARALLAMASGLALISVGATVAAGI